MIVDFAALVFSVLEGKEKEERKKGRKEKSTFGISSLSMTNIDLQFNHITTCEEALLQVLHASCPAINIKIDGY